jgi:hypothetical protein
MGSMEDVRMRARNYAGVASVVGLMLSGAGVAAQSSPPGPNPSPQLQRWQLELAVKAAARLAIKPNVVCGMTVVPADPKVDPKVIKPVPDQATKPTIREVAPGACR